MRLATVDIYFGLTTDDAVQEAPILVEMKQAGCAGRADRPRRQGPGCSAAGPGRAFADQGAAVAGRPARGVRHTPAAPPRQPATATRGGYLPAIAPNSSVDPNPSSAPGPALPVARASAATAAATAGATSRLNTEGMM